MNQNKLDMIKVLMSIKLFSKQEDIKENIEECTNWFCDYFHIKKGYKDEFGTWVMNPDYELLMVWISINTGFEFDGKGWVETKQSKALKRFR